MRQLELSPCVEQLRSPVRIAKDYQKNVITSLTLYIQNYIGNGPTNGHGASKPGAPNSPLLPL